jgi:hypothetical protein
MNTILQFILMLAALLLVAAAFVPQFRAGFKAQRESCWNAVAYPAHPHETGHVPVTLEAALTAKHLLVKKGTAAGSAIVCTATGIPLGPVADEGAIGDVRTVALLGAAPGTVTMIASKAIAENTLVYSTAAGKVIEYAVANAYKVGYTAPGSSAAADGAPIEVVPCFPVIVPA